MLTCNKGFKPNIWLVQHISQDVGEKMASIKKFIILCNRPHTLRLLTMTLELCNTGMF
ncbi:hypothetical protein predicted by Glimmer/Critica [Acetobacter ghanensis]|uniref:Uncharacterized protein n=1 Tax=Acetobacter ghanensis TaxID=431306 RepID=A0A0U5FCG2_9PROT|nr:hypothetical protein predicted by Glimmer/Critica [Acetobacter ghanensis]